MAPTAQTTDGEMAAEEAWRPLSFNEGPRIGILGDSGVGKTEAARRLIAEYLKRCPGTVLIVDDKEPQPQFVGQYRRDRAELLARPAEENHPGGRVVVFRGERFDREQGEVDPETIAEIQWSMCQQNLRSLVVYDELDKACSGGQWKRGSKSTILWAFRRGRNSGASSLWGTQETQEVPAGAFNQSSVILCFRLVGAPLRLLEQRGYLNSGADGRDVGEVISRLPGDELPREERGYFVMLRRGRPWDGRVYRFKPSKAERGRGTSEAPPAVDPSEGMRRGAQGGDLGLPPDPASTEDDT